MHLLAALYALICSLICRWRRNDSSICIHAKQHSQRCGSVCAYSVLGVGMSELIPLLASNVMGIATGYLIGRLANPKSAAAVPVIEPALVAPYVLFPPNTPQREAVVWLRWLADALEAKQRQKDADIRADRGAS